MATTLKGRLLNDGTLGPTTNLGDLLVPNTVTLDLARASLNAALLAALPTAL